jgi:hypothetical protein
MQSGQQIEAMIGALLNASLPVVRNCFTAEAVREVLAENFDSWAEARAEDPEDGQRPLWDLIMDDRDWDNAAFVVWVWDEEAVWLACGAGNSAAVQHFCGERAACECAGLLAAMRKQFHMPAEPLALPNRAVEQWIGRTWGENEEPPG